MKEPFKSQDNKTPTNLFLAFLRVNARMKPMLTKRRFFGDNLGGRGTGLFISAADENEALEWGTIVAETLLNHVHVTEHLRLDQFQHQCTIEQSPSNCGWSHCLEFFQHVVFGEFPDLATMTSDAYAKWQEENA